MSTPRATKRDELKDVISLINEVFRTSINEKLTMQQEFPLLLNENNRENMRIIVEDDLPVSVVSFFKEDISIENSMIKAASIGGVCTKESYRGRNYSSQILDDVENKMFNDGVEVVLISGTRTLYTRRDCILANSFYEYKIKGVQKENDILVEEYREEDFNTMVQMYNKISTRYVRTYDQFKTFLDSATIPWGNFTYKKYVIKKNNEMVGYIILRIIDKEKKEGQVIESFGTPEYISSALSTLAKEHNLEHIFYYVHRKDYINHIHNYEERKITNIQGTVKIINFEKFMSSLKPYMSQYVNENILENIEFRQNNEKFTIKIHKEELTVESYADITRLVFEGTENMNFNFSDKPKLKKFIDNVFPIPFVWTANLNYQ